MGSPSGIATPPTVQASGGVGSVAAAEAPGVAKTNAAMRAAEATTRRWDKESSSDRGWIRFGMSKPCFGVPVVERSQAAYSRRSAESEKNADSISALRRCRFPQPSLYRPSTAKDRAKRARSTPRELWNGLLAGGSVAGSGA